MTRPDFIRLHDEGNKVDMKLFPFVSKKESGKRMETLISADFYESLFKYHPDIVYSLDLRGNFIEANQAFTNLLGYAEEEIKGPFARMLPRNQINRVKNFYNKALKGEAKNFDLYVNHKDGRIMELNNTIIPMIVDGQILGIYGIAKDITEENQNKRSSQKREQMFRSLFERNPDAVSYLDLQGKFINCNQSLERILGYSKSELVDSTFERLVVTTSVEEAWTHFHRACGGEPQSYDLVCQHKNGTIVNMSVTNLPIFVDNQVIGIYSIAKDITKRKQAEKQNDYLANHDHLTGLPNRKMFLEKLDQALTISKVCQQKLAVMVLDMDRFKYINDSLGHSTGDRLLIQIAERLRQCVQEDDLIARMGGDEFSILLPTIQGVDDTVKVAQNIIHKIEEPLLMDDYELYITTSVGISIYPTDGDDAQSLLKNADSALHYAKDLGKNTYQIFTSTMNVHTYKLFSLYRDIHKAIEQNELELYYQPKVNTMTGQIVGAEALIRWEHPEWGLIYPDEFLRLADESGLMAKISEWVNGNLCIQIKKWLDDGLSPIPISMNISAKRFLYHDLCSTVKTLLQETGLDPHFLEIEITEDAFLENEEMVLSTLDELKEMGVKIALDDF